MTTLLLVESERDFLRDIVTRAVVDLSEALGGHGKFMKPHTYAQLTIACTVHAMLHAAPQDAAAWPAPFRRGPDALLRESQYDVLYREAGLDPDRELGPIDPRALHPRCVHGMYFTEPCELCSPPTGAEITAEQQAASDRMHEPVAGSPPDPAT